MNDKQTMEYLHRREYDKDKKTLERRIYNRKISEYLMIFAMILSAVAIVGIFIGFIHQLQVIQVLNSSIATNYTHLKAQFLNSTLNKTGTISLINYTVYQKTEPLLVIPLGISLLFIFVLFYGLLCFSDNLREKYVHQKKGYEEQIAELKAIKPEEYDKPFEWIK